MTFTPDELRIILHWWGVYENEMHTSDADESLEGKIRNHLERLEKYSLGEIRVSPMVRQLLNQAHIFSLDAKELTLHLRPEHKHLLTFQPELCIALKKYFNNDDFAVTVIVKHEKESI